MGKYRCAKASQSSTRCSVKNILRPIIKNPVNIFCKKVKTSFSLGQRLVSHKSDLEIRKIVFTTSDKLGLVVPPQRFRDYSENMFSLIPPPRNAYFQLRRLSMITHVRDVEELTCHEFRQRPWVYTFLHVQRSKTNLIVYGNIKFNLHRNLWQV